MKGIFWSSSSRTDNTLYISWVTMGNVGYDCGLQVIHIPQCEFEVKHLGVNNLAEALFVSVFHPLDQ